MATELKKGTHKREADEFLEVHIRRWSEVMDMIRTGQIVDGKTLVAILFVQSFRR